MGANEYKRPSVASDIVVFGLSKENNEKNNSNTVCLNLLLIKRGEEPYKDCYSLPGGFIREHETIEETAFRELKEETGIIEDTNKNSIKLINLKLYSEPERDPRGWIISNAFIALTNTMEVNSSAESDANGAYWFKFNYNEEKEVIELTRNNDTIEISMGTGEETDTAQKQLGFDHSVIIRDAFLKLRDEVVYHDIIFDLLPDLFSISDVQKPYELITGDKTTIQNFRKKILSKVEETDIYDKGMAHRPSKLYRRK